MKREYLKPAFAIITIANEQGILAASSLDRSMGAGIGDPLGQGEDWD